MYSQQFTEQFKEFLKPLVKEVLKEEMSEGLSPDKANPEKLLSVREAAKEHGCPEFLLRRAMNRAELPYYTPNNSRVYVKRGEVAKFFDSIRIKSNDEIQNDYPFLKTKRK